MKYIKVVVALLFFVGLFLAGHMIFYYIQVRVSVKKISEGEVYIAHQMDDPNANEQIKSFYFLAEKAHLSKIKKLLNHCQPSVRTYAYLIYLARTQDVNFEYLVNQLRFRSEVLYTNNSKYFIERKCFDTDVMLLSAIKHPEAIIPGFSYINLEFNLSLPQIDSLLKILESKEPIDPVLNTEIIDWLNYLKHGTDDE